MSEKSKVSDKAVLLQNKDINIIVIAPTTATVNNSMDDEMQNIQQNQMGQLTAATVPGGAFNEVEPAEETSNGNGTLHLDTSDKENTLFKRKFESDLVQNGTLLSMPTSSVEKFLFQPEIQNRTLKTLHTPKENVSDKQEPTARAESGSSVPRMANSFSVASTADTEYTSLQSKCEASNIYSTLYQQLKRRHIRASLVAELFCKPEVQNTSLTTQRPLGQSAYEKEGSFEGAGTEMSFRGVGASSSASPLSTLGRAVPEHPAIRLPSPQNIQHPLQLKPIITAIRTTIIRTLTQSPRHYNLNLHPPTYIPPSLNTIPQQELVFKILSVPVCCSTMNLKYIPIIRLGTRVNGAVAIEQHIAQRLVAYIKKTEGRCCTRLFRRRMQQLVNSNVTFDSSSEEDGPAAGHGRNMGRRRRIHFPIVDIEVEYVPPGQTRDCIITFHRLAS